MVGDEGTQALRRAGGRLVQRRLGLREQGLHVLADQVEQQVLLGADVVVERGGLDPRLGGQLAQAHRLEATAVDEPQPGTADGGGGALPVGSSTAAHAIPSGGTPPSDRRVGTASVGGNIKTNTRLLA